MSMQMKNWMEELRLSVETRLCVADGYQVTLGKVLKNNDRELDALTISKHGEKAAPAIYLNDYESQIAEGIDLQQITEEIVAIYHRRPKKLTFDLDDFQKFEHVKPQLAVKLVHTKLNQKLLQNVPHVDFLDLSLVCFFVVPGTSVPGEATALIHDSHLKIWGITKEELFDHARKNTPLIFPEEIRNMDDIILEMLEGEIRESVPADLIREEPEYCARAARDQMDELYEDRDAGIQMYVLSNRYKINGAVCMLYDHVLERFADQVQEDLYILPSSIHEVLLIPAGDGIEKEQLSAMVRQVNRDAVLADEILSDHVYYYQRNTDKIVSF